MSPSGVLISLDQFFSSEPEFMDNRELFDSVTRTLKALMRHPQDINFIASKNDTTYYLGFQGKCREYTLSFELGDDLLLTGLS